MFSAVYCENDTGVSLSIKKPAGNCSTMLLTDDDNLLDKDPNNVLSPESLFCLNFTLPSFFTDLPDFVLGATVSSLRSSIVKNSEKGTDVKLLVSLWGIVLSIEKFVAVSWLDPSVI